MTGIIFLLTYGILCGFYVHVFIRLDREHKLLNAKKHPLQFYFYRAELDSENAWTEKVSGYRASRKQALTELALGMGGVAVLFVGIELFNLLLTRH
ncbi:MAG: hypothetical protein ABSB65_03390 [Candidatus Acidiferrales bacterium]|jgi:hypothetical protein